MDSEPAQTYLRTLAEAELRAFAGDAPARTSRAGSRVRAVASAFTQIATPGTWNNGGVIEFAASVLPPLTPSAASVDILIIGRAAQARAAVPLIWRTL